jgi:tRNA(Ile2) C34 agmatinyltransferase TiaS
MLSGMEWEEHTKGEKDYKCPDCGADLNEDELYGEE